MHIQQAAGQNRQSWVNFDFTPVLEQLTDSSVEHIAERLGVRPASLRAALQYRGVKVRKHRKSKKIKGPKPKATWSAPRISERTFEAMRAIEAYKGGCAWPIGDLDSSFSYCDAPKQAGKCYCPKHVKLSHLRH